MTGKILKSFIYLYDGSCSDALLTDLATSDQPVTKECIHPGRGRGVLGALRGVHGAVRGVLGAFRGSDAALGFKVDLKLTRCLLGEVREGK
jgi:hypothetical protein